jgi:hypothetical protein
MGPPGQPAHLAAPPRRYHRTAGLEPHSRDEQQVPDVLGARGHKDRVGEGWRLGLA